ncbi:hypothetical protein SB758_32455, partial [Burkholderia sp. SIMBA_013]
FVLLHPFGRCASIPFVPPLSVSATAGGAAGAKVQAKEGATWILTFRHPLKSDQRGKPGRKMRRSAGTTDASRAEELREQLNGWRRLNLT